MSHLWLKDPAAPLEWSVLTLDAGASGYVLSGRPADPVRTVRRRGRPLSGALVTPAAVDGEEEAWTLLALPGSGVYLNGLPLFSGIRVLQSKDEIRLGSVRLFFSTERMPEAMELPGSERKVDCARCSKTIEVGSMAVRCPNPSCALWHHQSSDLPCWTGYKEKPFVTCQFCNQPATLEARFSWTPEGL